MGSLAAASAPARGIGLLEHVNVDIPAHQPAAKFYFDALGLAMDPRRAMNFPKGSGTLWANIGYSQFHLPVGKAQVVPGRIHLGYTDLQEVRTRLEATGTPFDSVGDTLVTRCPYGNVFVLHGGCDRPQATQPGPASLGVALMGVDIRCAVGAAAGIARFYRFVFDADLEERPGELLVKYGPAQFVRYYEDPAPSSYDGHHVSLYMASMEAFERAYRRAEELGLIWVNERFRDRSYTWEAACNEYQQFRLKEMVDPETREVVHRLEHEVRAITHAVYPLRESPP